MTVPGDPESDHWMPLDPRWLPMARTRAWIRIAIWGAVFAVPTLLVGWLADLDRGGVAVLLAAAGVPFIVLAVLLLVLPPHQYRHGAWRVDAEGVSLRWGAWWRSEQRVTRSRIQHTDVAQGPLERQHGLGRLIVHTAGAHHSQLVIPGLAYELAVELRDLLLAHDGSDEPV